MDTPDKKDETKFSEQIAKKEKRKLKAQRVNSGSVWAGLGMFGMVGWSVAIPTLLGAALGIWLDKKYPQSFSWVLSFLMIGLITGCIIAWYWVDKEDKQMHQNQDENDE
jgi:ATP synthase protein I